MPIGRVAGLVGAIVLFLIGVGVIYAWETAPAGKPTAETVRVGAAIAQAPSEARAQTCSAGASLSIVAWGDSLTDGPLGPPPYPAQLASLTGCAVVNKGFSGFTSPQILQRMLAAPKYFGHPSIIWSGHNNWNKPVQVKADVASMVAALTTKHYLVLGLLNGAQQRKNGADYKVITQLNNELAKAYPGHFIDIRAYLVSRYDPKLPQDALDHDNDVPPMSLRHDALHLNARGNCAVAVKVATSLPMLLGTPSHLDPKAVAEFCKSR